MSAVRLQHKQLYLTFLDPEEKIAGPGWLLSALIEKLEQYDPYYGIACQEEAPTTGTNHFHVLILCRKTVSRRNGDIIEVEGIHPHVEKVRNNLRMIIKYIMKNGNVAKFNEDQCPVQMNKLTREEKANVMLTGDLKKAFLDGTLGSIEVLRAEKLRRLFDVYEEPEPYQKKLVLWFHGETGEKKTRTAIDIANRYNLKYWMSNESLKWFDGYIGQQMAIIDDFRKGMLSDWSFLLRILDGYSLKVQVKGGYIKWNPKIIVITTPAMPNEAFQWINREGQTMEWDHQDQLTRRLVYDDVEQIYEFPLWKEEEERLTRTVEKFLGINNETAMIEDEFSMSPILPEPTQIDEA